LEISGATWWLQTLGSQNDERHSHGLHSVGRDRDGAGYRLGLDLGDLMADLFRLPRMFRDPVKERMDDVTARVASFDTEMEAISCMMEWFYRLPTDHDRRRVLNYIADRVMHERPLAVDQQVVPTEKPYKFEE